MVDQVYLDDSNVIIELVVTLANKIRHNENFFELMEKYCGDSSYTIRVFSESYIKTIMTEELSDPSNFDNYIFDIDVKKKEVVLRSTHNNIFNVRHYFNYGGDGGDRISSKEKKDLRLCDQYSTFFDVFTSNMTGDFSISYKEMSKETFNYFVEFHLEPGDDLRGAASIKDTGLFDFKI